MDRLVNGYGHRYIQQLANGLLEILKKNVNSEKQIEIKYRYTYRGIDRWINRYIKRQIDRKYIKKQKINKQKKRIVDIYIDRYNDWWKKIDRQIESYIKTFTLIDRSYKISSTSCLLIGWMDVWNGQIDKLIDIVKDE